MPPTTVHREETSMTPALADLAATTAPATAAEPDRTRRRCVVVHLSGRLSIVDLPTGGRTTVTLRRRTASGDLGRVELDHGISCWLDGDLQHDGQLNWAATQLCAALSTAPFAGPGDAPFVCGPVLFANTDQGRPTGLDATQLARIVHAHAGVADLAGWPAPAADAVR
jgi:hypothetical protein